MSRPALVVLLAAVSLASEGSRPNPLTLAAAPGDTVRAIARWSPYSDSLGPATSYVVNWLYRRMGASADSPLLDLKPQRETAQLSDTALVALPPLGDSLLVVVTVTPKRRGLTGDSRSAQRFFGRRDVRPGMVGSVALDTLP